MIAPNADYKKDEVLLDLVHRLNVGVYRNKPGVEGRFVYCSDGLAEITGYSLKELYDIPVSRLYPEPKDRERFETEIKEAGFVRSKQLRLLNKRGESIYVEITAVAKMDESTSKVLHYDGIVLDVTSEVDVYSNISHQISTPVLGIIHSAQRLLKEGNLGAKSALLLKSILGSSHLALFLTRNLNYMSSILDMSSQAFRRNLSPRKIAPTLFKIVIDLQEYAQQEKEIRISVDSKSLNALAPVRMDETAFTMAAFCILDNAIKYAFEQTTVRVKGLQSLRYTSVLVENEGIPLTKEHLPPRHPNIFTKQHRTDEAKRFTPGGAGLGLYIAFQIMQLHDGNVFADPSNDYITTFRLAFPNRT